MVSEVVRPEGDPANAAGHVEKPVIRNQLPASFSHTRLRRMPPKNFQLTFAWMLLATILMGAAVWQAQVTAARETAAKHAVLPPPPKTRHAVRPPPVTFSGSVADDYVARCEKGTTDQEILWAIEDFNRAGLDLAPEPSTEVMLRAARQRWYHAALVDALRLSPAQAMQAKERLTNHLVKAWGELPDKNTAAGPAFTDLWLDSPDFQPWKLCDLTPVQASVTWKDHMEAPPDSQPPSLAEKKTAADFLLRSPLVPTASEERDRVPLWAYPANTTFPLLANQKLQPSPTPDEAPALFLENVRKLHPAQLRMLLLREPQLVPLVRSTLSSQPNR